jgi:hypothetical protein
MILGIPSANMNNEKTSPLDGLEVLEAASAWR